MFSSPISTSHGLILDIDIGLDLLSTLGGNSCGEMVSLTKTEISYESHLITTQFRSDFYIYILDRSFFLMLYNIAVISHYSRCVIRQLL